MSLREVIYGAVQSSSAGQHLAETGIQNITDNIIEGLQASGAEGIAEFAKLALTGAPKKGPVKRRTPAKRTAKTDRSTNAAKGQGSRIRGAVARIMRGEARAGDEKLIRGDKERALTFAGRLGKTPDQKKLIEDIVTGAGKPSGFPTVES